MDISPRLDSITQDQIQQVLNRHSDSRDSFVLFGPKNHSSNRDDVILHDSYEQSDTLIEFCDKLLSEARNPHTHASRIDYLLSGLIRCSFCRPELPNDIVSDTQRLLRRLPVHSLPLPTLIAQWMDGNFFPI